MEKAAQLTHEINSRAGHIVLDWPLLQKNCLNKEELVVKLLGLFIVQTPLWIQELKSSVGELDPDKIRKICHTIKGATTAIYANACVDSVERLNVIAREQEDDLAGVQEALDNVVFTLESTKKDIAEILKVCSVP